MPATRKISVTLSDDLVQMVEAKVSSGEYQSESEGIGDGLRALQAREHAIERWLCEEVAPAARAMEADPSRGLTVEEVRASLAARHEKATAAGR